MIISGGRKRRIKPTIIIKKEIKISIKNRKEGQIKDLAKKRDTMNKKITRKKKKNTTNTIKQQLK
jgi:hypothetical protein